MQKTAFGTFSIDQSGRSFLVWTTVALLLLGGVALLWFVNQPAYIWLGTEDSWGENLTAVFYLIAGILLLAHVLHRSKSDFPGKQKLLTVLLGLFFLWMAGEEISWGQRIFGFGTPDSMITANVQQEFNIHNLQPLSGPTAWIDPHRLFSIFMLFNGILLPLAYRFWWPARRLMNRISFPVVPLSCVGFFVMGLLHSPLVARPGYHWAHSEVQELIFSVGFLAGCLSIYQGRNRLPS